jgi:hypothetical protein
MVDAFRTHNTKKATMTDTKTTRYVVIYLTGITLNMQEFSTPESRAHYIKTCGPYTDRIVTIFEVEV